MEIWAAVEYNESGCMAFARDYPGAFARGKEQTEALNKLAGDVAAYWRWLTGAAPALGPVRVAEHWPSKAQLADGDTEMLLEGEEAPLLESEYRHLQGVALRSAGDFLRLYRAIPEPDRELMPPRQTFYGPVPRTAAEMLIHVAGVNAYYFSRIGVAAGDGLEMVQQRAAGFAVLESQGGYLDGGGRTAAGSVGPCARCCGALFGTTASMPGRYTGGRQGCGARRRSPIPIVLKVLLLIERAAEAALPLCVGMRLVWRRPRRRGTWPGETGLVWRLGHGEKIFGETVRFAPLARPLDEEVSGWRSLRRYTGAISGMYTCMPRR